MLQVKRSFAKQLKLLISLSLFLQIRTFAQSPDEIKITNNYKNVGIINFFNDLERQYPVKFYYKPEWFQNDTINLTLDNTSLHDAVDLAIKNAPYLYDIIQGNAFVFMPKDKVAIIMGQMINMAENDINTKIIGNPEDIGKYAKVEIKGKVVDGKTGEPLIGATVQIENTNIGVVSNVSGNYSFILAPGTYNFMVSNVGYEKSYYKIKLISKGSLDMELFEKSVKLGEIVVYAQRADKNVSNNQMSIVELDAKAIKQLPSMMGEKDIVKSFTMLPGVTSIGEFGSGINVRGGGDDQNLFLIEGTPVFNTAHVFGLLSVINPDVVNSATLYKGDIPANFGERVSSVMDIMIKDNNSKILQVNGGIGLLNSRLMLECPIYKDKVTFKIGGRSSYSDWLLKQMPDINLRNSSAKFYDFNGLVNWSGDKDKITLFGYVSNDQFGYASELNYGYGNYLGSINWNHYFNNTLNTSLMFNYSKYQVNKDDIQNEYEESHTFSEVDYQGIKFNTNYTSFQHHNIDAGFQGIYYSIMPGKLTPLDTQSLVSPFKMRSEQSIETGLYINDKYDINEFISINAGLRFSAYFYLGPGIVDMYRPGESMTSTSVIDSTIYKKGAIIKEYQGLEPRLSIKFQTSESSSIKASYNHNNQYISLISYTSIATPDDVWKLSDTYIKPIICNQYALGFFNNFEKNTIETSIEVYYKTLNNLIEYKNGAQIDLNEHLETALIDARGKNYGIEFLVKKNSGKFDGWISYTYSRSLKQTLGKYPDEIINNNNYYPSSYDKPNDLSILGTYHVTRRFRISGNFNYTSGRAATLPELKYNFQSYQLIDYSDRNKYRLPAYHRLDLSISYDENLKVKRNWRSSWTFSIINVYARKNAYSIFYKEEQPSPQNDFRQYSLYELYIIGQPLPTLTYNFIF
jgi:hypothetical protein